MEKHGRSEMEMVPSEPHSFIKLLKVNREHLVTHIRNTQCLLDNLLQNDYFSTEDAEIVCACPTQPDKVLVTGRPALVARWGEELREFSTLGDYLQNRNYIFHFCDHDTANSSDPLHSPCCVYWFSDNSFSNSL